MARKRLYVPITRSGSSIIASILTQMLQNAAQQRKEEVNKRLQRGEITERQAMLQRNPGCMAFLYMLPVGFALALLLRGCS